LVKPPDRQYIRLDLVEFLFDSQGSKIDRVRETAEKNEESDYFLQNCDVTLV